LIRAQVGAEAALRDVVVEIGRLVEGVVDDPAAQLERSVHAFAISRERSRR
jgi:hypothetical protein